MNTRTSLPEIIQNKAGTIKQALQLFDDSPSVDFAFMQGQWKGYEIKTGHAMEGLLECTGWYGKKFVSPEEVHPLLFYKLNRKDTYSVNPMLLPMNLPLPRTNILAVLLSLLSPFLQTRKGKARLRMMEYRGKVTGCMVYDHKAIIDVFVKIDENTLLGIMDAKDDQPYAFLLERESAAK